MFQNSSLRHWVKSASFLFQIIFIIGFSSNPAFAAEDPFEELQGSSASYDFTKAERKYFIDAPNKFKKYEISSDFKSRSIVAWLDNDHIAFSARKYPGWEAQPEELSHVISLNIVTGKFTDSGYRGRLMCLNHLGDILVRQGEPELFESAHPENYQWLSGKWGQDLSPTPWMQSSFIPRFTCKFAPIGDRIYFVKPQQVNSESHRDFPLLPEHGVLRETVEFIDGKEVHPVHLIKPDGSSKFLFEKLPSDIFFFFHPWANAYINQTSIHNNPKILHPSGEISLLNQPPLLRYWAASAPPPSIAISIRAILTKAGLIWDVYQTYKFWHKNGLYLDTKDGLLRIEEGHGSNALVSPNGCRIMDSISRGDTWSSPGKKGIFLIIDVCTLKK